MRLRVALLATLLLLAACGSKVQLYGDLKEQEANEMLALLLRAGIDAETSVTKGVVTLTVPKDHLPEAVELLDNAGLPQAKFTTMGDLFAKQGLISSPSEERVRYMYGITQELSRTLMEIDGVLNARVHVVLAENDPLAQQAKPASAAVLIRYAPGAAVETLIPKIKQLVANSIEGLAYDNVSVVLVRASPLAPATLITADAGAGAANLPSAVIYAGGALLVLSVVGNAAFAAMLFWRRRPRASPEQALVTASS